MSDKDNVLDHSDSSKRSYTRPQFAFYGTVRDLTRNSGGSNVEVAGSCNQPKSPVMVCSSERRFKENIHRIGTHPLGIGLYLFEYISEYRELWGYGRKLGVMVDELEKVMPGAIHIHPDGYKQVNYTMLGINHETP